MGDDYPDTRTSMANLASFYGDKKDLTPAEPLYRTAIIKGIVKLGENHPDTIQYKKNYRIDFGKDFVA